MKLSNSHREAFVRAAMQDVPKVDYQQQAEDLVRKEATASLPPKVRAVYEDDKLRDYLTSGLYFHLGNALQSRYFRAAHGFKISAPIATKLAQISELAGAQKSRLLALDASLKGAALSVTTRKALAELMPEFAKYLPAEVEVTKNLPAVANIVADFTKAGWPAGAKKSKAR